MIGSPIDRVDGPLKVTGRATYEYEEWGLGKPLYGVIVGATIGHGRIEHIDSKRAEQAPGVRRVLTHRDAPEQELPGEGGSYRYARPYPVLNGPEVHHYGEPVALVLAETFEQASWAASLVEVRYSVADGDYDFEAVGDSRIYTPERVNAGFAVDSMVGDFDAAFADAEVELDAVYTTPYEFSMPMELHCCLASWTGDSVTVHTSTQDVGSARARIAGTLGLEPEKVEVVSRFVGGGFGSKLGIHAETILAVIAARAVKEPVKIALTRQQMFHLVGQRPASRQRVRLGARRDGTLVAIGHDVTMKTSRGDDYVEQIATVIRSFYAAPHRRSTHRAIDLDLMISEDVRGPGEAPGLLAIESAMDELAQVLEIDPLELRIKNEPSMHPERDIPYSERRLVECMREGARRFGWDRRPCVPGSVREGRKLVGYGMAAAIRPHFQTETTVKVRLEPDGSAVVLSDMTDLGTGTYTILAQVVGEALDLPVDRVRVLLGRSEYPRSSGSGGSFGASNSTTAAFRACQVLREQNFPVGVDAQGSVRDESNESRTHSKNMYGAQFAEVRVDVDTGEVRVVRMLGVFDAGRILNAKTARSQLLGGMIWGLSAALLEEGLVDPRFGSFINHDLAQYLVPVHADVPEIEAIMLDAFDEHANELGAKGIGELGICGAGAAIANAVFNAAGIRVREFPITIEKLLPGLSALT